MTHTERQTGESGGDSARTEYEAPGVESVVTPEELEREVVYGGGAQSPAVPALG